MKFYDFLNIEKILTFYKQKGLDFIRNEENKNDFLFIFFVDNEKIRIAYDEFQFSYIFKLDDQYCIIYSLNKNNFINFSEWPVIINKNYGLLTYNGFLEETEEPEAWLYFLKRYFSLVVEDDKKVSELIEYLCLFYNHLFVHINENTIIKETKNKLYVGYELYDNEEEDKNLQTKLKKITITLPLSYNDVDLNFYSDLKSTLPGILVRVSSQQSKIDFNKEVNNLSIDIPAKNYNIIFEINGNIDFIKNNLNIILMKAFIKLFYTCEELFIPGVNLKILDERILQLINISKENHLYNSIIDSEYKLILSYILKIKQKYALEKLLEERDDNFK